LCWNPLFALPSQDALVSVQRQLGTEHVIFVPFGGWVSQLDEVDAVPRDPKPRTLYRLRHTAIVRSIQKGLPLEMIAANSRIGSVMIRRFYGSHVKSVLYMGSHFVDKEKSIRDERYSMVNALAKEIGFEFDADTVDET
jgi:hypothetical protein